MSERIDTDAVLHSAMRARHFEEDGETLDFEGDLYQTSKEKQRAELAFFKVGSDVGSEVRTHVLLHALFERPAHALGWVGSAFIGAGIETIAKAVETVHQGEELKAAVLRECAVGACAILCKSALPEGFRTDLRQQFLTKGQFSEGTRAVCETLLMRPDAARIQQGMLDNCRDGQRYAIDRHITTAADLRVALENNPEFASRYQGDLAFKLGTDSVIWADAHLELPTLELQLPPAPAAAVVEVRG